MWYAIGYILFALSVFAFIYGAGKANKAWDESTEKWIQSKESEYGNS